MGRIKRGIMSMVRNRGSFVSKTTDPARLKSFFRSVQPVTTNVPLIRIGGEGDGGYLVPDDFEGVKTCFSPGVSDVANFELNLADRGISCFLADASVEAPPLTHPRFDFEKKFLGAHTQDIFLSLSDWVAAKSPTDRDMILQMDIEGAEYEVLYATSEELLGRFRIIVIEFHDLDRLIDAFSFEYLRLTFEKLTRQFDVVHLHPNNNGRLVQYGRFFIPPILEATFLRRDRSSSRLPRTDFPHPLDHANNVDNKRGDLALPACWFHDEH